MLQKSTLLACGLLASLASFSLNAQDASEPVAAPSKEAMIEAFGYFSAFQMGLSNLGFTTEDAEAINRGITRALGDSEPSPEMMAMVQGPVFQSFIQERVEAAQAEQEAAAASSAGGNIEAGKAFIEELKVEDDTVESTESGLHYKVLKTGDEEQMPTMEDTVLVHYKGTRIDGTQFDSSYDRGEPATFPLNGVVPGFGEGLTKIGVGGKILLYIPSELGYGNSPRPGGAIEPGDTLVFECELIEVNPGQ
jgi:FKBP-type peptidyl-prolyl cis-trans isomerase